MDSGLINAIGKHDQVIVSQVVDWIECLPLCVCCEKRNVYYILFYNNRYNVYTMDEKLETEMNLICQVL